MLILTFDWQGKLNKLFRRAQEDPDSKKAAMATIAQLMGDSISLMDLAMGSIKKPLEASPGIPLLDGLLENMKDFMEKTKTYVEKQMKLDEDTEQNAEKDEL